MDSQATGSETTPQASYTVIPCTIKSIRESYKPLIFSKWLRSLRYGNEYFKLIDQKSYFSVYHRYIESVLSKSTTTIRLAVLSDDTDIVLGFSVMEPGVLHYVHVHADQRKQGIAKSLCKDVKIITHVTNDGLKVWAKYPGVKFNPFEG